MSKEDRSIEERGFVERLNRAVEKAGSAAVVAQKADIPLKSVYNWMNGTNTSKALTFAKLAAACNVSVEELLDQAQPSGRLTGLANETSLLPLQKYDIRASAGPGGLAHSEDITEIFHVSPEWLARFVPAHRRCGAIQVVGDSMEPTIRDGDLLIVAFDTTRQEVVGGGVFVITYNGETMVKRLKVQLDGSLLVKSDNSGDYPPKMLSSEEATRVIIHAKVVWSGGPIRSR